MVEVGMSHHNPIRPVDIIRAKAWTNRRGDAVNVGIEKDHQLAKREPECGTPVPIKLCRCHRHLLVSVTLVLRVRSASARLRFVTVPAARVENGVATLAHLAPERGPLLFRVQGPNGACELVAHDQVIARRRTILARRLDRHYAPSWALLEHVMRGTERSHDA